MRTILTLSILLGSWAWGQTGDFPANTQFRFIPITLRHFEKVTSIKNKNCILYPFAPDGETWVVCNGMTEIGFDLWTEPAVLPTSATVTIATPPEPIDVPAIPVKILCQVFDGTKWQSAPCGSTCADKSRILLTAEDGKKWCHAPQP
jgi:hypothetical protein